jgi:hypothetical protein
MKLCGHNERHEPSQMKLCGHNERHEPSQMEQNLMTL